MRRREFIGLLGAMAACPLDASAQPPKMPVIGYLYAGSHASVAHLVGQFRAGLAKSGFVEGQNVAIEYRFADGRYERLPELVADLVSRQVAVIVSAQTSAAAQAAIAGTSTIPIVFSVNDDPVKLGLVDSLSRPGANATGVNFVVGELGAKRLGLLRELAPNATRVGWLMNPNNLGADFQTKDLTTAADSIGVKIDVVPARDLSEIDAAFETLARNKVGGLVLTGDTIFTNRRVQIVVRAARLGIPAAYSVREFVEAGGLMSYGTNLSDVYQQLGVYAARILNGAKPADLPVLQLSKFELVINLSTAKALGLTIPNALMLLVDEIIE
jgi:putative ABC transport system substrate-binding protein